MDFILYSQEGLWFLRIPLHRYAKFLADEKKQKYAYLYITQLSLTESTNFAFKFACLGQYGHSSKFGRIFARFLLLALHGYSLYQACNFMYIWNIYKNRFIYKIINFNYLLL